MAGSGGAGNSVFLIRALEKIVGDKETKRAQHQQLKKACEEALKDIKEEIKQRKAKSSKSTILPSPGSADGSADKYFIPFELACKSNVPRIINTSLDCIQKLVAYGHLLGDSVDPDNPDKRLVDRMINTVCECFIGVNTDEGIQLQIIKALLTILTSKNVEVHGGTILQSVRCCYNIYLASRSPINQTTAKASLTQIISTLYQLMENEKSLQATARDKMASSFPTPPPSRIDGQAAKSSTFKEQFPRQPSPWEEACQKRRDQLDPELLTTATKLVEQVLAKVVAEECLRLPIEEPLLPDPVGSTAASTVDDTESITSSVSEMRDPSPHPSSTQVMGGMKGQELQFRHILQKDCYLVFRTLCKLSMKPVTATHDSRSHELRSKILSLEMLLSILENSGPVFRTDEVFIGAIKHHLCVALSKNGVSSVPEVFELSLSIFLSLFSSFKPHLKMQIEVFFKEIFLNILETPTSSFKHKWVVLNCLSRVCGDSQSVVDIFLNYDCDLSLSNIYARLVNDLSRIGQGRQAVELGATPHEQKLIRAKGLECLVSILKCLVEWSRDLYINPTTTGLYATSSIAGSGSGFDANTERPVPNKGVSTLRRGVAKSTEGVDGDEMGGVLATDNPEQFEEQKLKKEKMEEGLKLFAAKPKKGVKFLQEQQLIGRTPQDVARFFFDDERLDKTAMGDYMGEFEDFAKSTMYAYVDIFDFKEMKFVVALRLLLSRFRLPGEAQKIDRIMEKFAGRYFETNTNLGVFASADAAYVLAYSIIMLTTDLHSSNVKTKMTKEDYIKMNRGINDSKDLPREYLEAIYDEVASSEIKLKTSSAEVKQGGTIRQSMVGVSEKQRKEAYKHVMDQLSETAQAIMEDISDKQSRFTSASHVEHARPMFKVAWTSVLAALSVALRDTDDPDVVSCCLDGFRCAIRVACVFELQLEKDAFIKTLARFTMLLTSTGITEMKAKNIEVIKTLCNVAYTDGNYLKSCWVDVLQCVSQLELAQLIGTGVKTRYLIGNPATPKQSRSSSNTTQGPSSIDTILSGSDPKKMATIQEHVEGTSNQSVVVAVDRIFTGSTRLDREAIVDFVEALCAVSNQELSSPAHPRMLSLQKIIEISYYNMGRIRLEMSRIWSVIGVHFNTVGCLPNDEVSLFVVDSLRQLSMKFVEKGELANFRFQKDFLRPFEHIVKRSESVAIRDMVVRCVTQIIQMRASNIVSGWKNIFSVFLLAAADHDQSIVEMSFQTTANIFEEHFDATIASFQDAVKCLAEFACNASYPDTSMEAIRIMRTCAKKIAEEPELFHSVTSDESGSGFDPGKLWMKVWFPIMFELSSIITRCKLDVRTRGLTVMFEIMKTYGHLYEQEWWKDIFGVVFRLFGDMKLPDSPSEKSEWMTTTCNHALYALMDVFGQFYDILCPVLLDDILTQLLWCVQQDNEQLARSGTNCLENLVISVGEQFTPSVWNRVCQCFHNIYLATVPEELLSWRPNETTPSISTVSLASSHSSIHSEAPQIQSHTPNTEMSVVPSDPQVTIETNDHAHETPSNHNTPEIVTMVRSPSPTHQGEGPDTGGQSATISPLTVSVTGEQPDDQDKANHLPSTQQTTLTGQESMDSALPSNKISKNRTPSVSSSIKDKKKQDSKKKKDGNDKKTSRQKSMKRTRKELKATPSVADDDKSELSVGHPDTDMTLAGARTQKLKVQTPEQSLFGFMIIKCVVQLELIQAIDNIVFYPTVTRQDDQNILHAAGVMSVNYPLPRPPYSDRGMFSHLSTSQLFVLVDCLYQSHMFARSFNSNNDQRIVLMKAGFRGRSKPNLLRQETTSILTMLRILYYMLEDSSREIDYQSIEDKLLSLVVSALDYFLSLTSDSHRLSWTPVLLLVFTRIIQVKCDEFKHHMAVCYSQLCELISQEMKYEVRCLLRRVFCRVGNDFSVSPNTDSV